MNTIGDRPGELPTSDSASSDRDPASAPVGVSGRDPELAPATFNAGPKVAALSEVRERIDAVDREVLRLLGERRRLSSDVARIKTQNAGVLRDAQREEELLLGLIRVGREHGLDAHYVTRLYHEVIDDSLRLQQAYLIGQANGQGVNASARVAFLGNEGSYSHQASLRAFARMSRTIIPIGRGSFAEVVRAVEEGIAEFGVLPIENTTSGGINEVYDLLHHTSLHIVGEEKLRVDHCLIGIAGADPAGVRVIYSHPQAVAQCREFLTQMAHCKIEYVTDTGSSA